VQIIRTFRKFLSPKKSECDILALHFFLGLFASSIHCKVIDPSSSDEEYKKNNVLILKLRDLTPCQFGSGCVSISLQYYSYFRFGQNGNYGTIPQICNTVCTNGHTQAETGGHRHFSAYFLGGACPHLPGNDPRVWGGILSSADRLFSILPTVASCGKISRNLVDRRRKKITSGKKNK